MKNIYLEHRLPVLLSQRESLKLQKQKVQTLFVMVAPVKATTRFVLSLQLKPLLLICPLLLLGVNGP